MRKAIWNTGAVRRAFTLQPFVSMQQRQGRGRMEEQCRFAN